MAANRDKPWRQRAAALVHAFPRLPRGAHRIFLPMNFCGTQRRKTRFTTVRRATAGRLLRFFSASATLSRSVANERKAEPVEMERERAIDRSFLRR